MLDMLNPPISRLLCDYPEAGTWEWEHTGQRVVSQLQACLKLPSSKWFPCSRAHSNTNTAPSPFPYRRTAEFTATMSYLCQRLSPLLESINHKCSITFTSPWLFFQSKTRIDSHALAVTKGNTDIVVEEIFLHHNLQKLLLYPLTICWILWTN